MGLFGKKLVACPACSEDLDRSENKMGHWMSHVTTLTSGEKAGSYIWTCACGSSDQCWEKDFQAAAGLSLHMVQRHQIPMS